MIIGGLVTNTLLDFLVLPGLFWKFGRQEAERLAHESVQTEDLDYIRRQLLPEAQEPKHLQAALADGQRIDPGDVEG